MDVLDKPGHDKFCGSMISIGAKLGELLVYPMPSITTAPDLSIDKSACDRSTRYQDRPQVPCPNPGWPRPHVHHRTVIVAVSNHERLSKKTKPPSGVYSPDGFAMLGPEKGNIRCQTR